MFGPMGPGVRFRIGATLFFVFAIAAAQAPSAWGGPGYQLDSSKSSIPVSGELPIGVAVDQSSQDIYAAEVSTALSIVAPGQIEQLNSAGVATADSPFGTGGEDLFLAVAVNPATHGVYAYQGEADTPLGHKGHSLITRFSSSGAPETSFSTAKSVVGTLAADLSGRLFFPSSEAGTVKVFSSSGTLESTITCSGCPGGSLGSPAGDAFDSAGRLYVVDHAGAGRLLRLAPSGGGYTYDKTIQSGGGVVAVAVDTSTDDVFVGNLINGQYHVTAYDSSGTAFDDFGTGLVTAPQGGEATGQLAVNATTHKLYLSNPGGNNLWVFERIASIPAPAASVTTPNAVGQVEATLRASVNPQGHVLTSCSFQYTNHADFLANGFANAATASCPGLIGDKTSVALSSLVKGLNPETTYDYRIKVASYGGAAESSTQSFQTLPPLPPEATTGAASALTRSSATLAGTVNPKGGAVSDCHFEYVTESAFQSGGFVGATSKACLLKPSGNAPASVSAKVTGMATATAYRFRVVVTTNSGTTQASSASFTTLAETCEENADLCPLPEASASPPPPATSLAPAGSPLPPKPLKCRKGFKKKKVHGKLKCVRVKKRH
ncbi:MAG: hypothetical protein ACLGG5_04945 [Thermoleophilia bacterium]